MLMTVLINIKQLGLEDFDHCQPLQIARDAKINKFDLPFCSGKIKTKALSGKLDLRLKLRAWL